MRRYIFLPKSVSFLRIWYHFTEGGIFFLSVGEWAVGGVK